ncbi:hypothetical protein [Streptomyces canus]|uniref:hypothetical protein n=1 Tax=Streptomyces canus TaxID=58343 RepID=UPI00039B0245|nr:hypothetical protein [Streptomyces canus]
MARTAPRNALRRLSSSPGLEPSLLAVTAVALAAGGVYRLVGAAELADLCWGIGTAVAVVPAVGWVLNALRRDKREST